MSWAAAEASSHLAPNGTAGSSILANADDLQMQDAVGVEVVEKLSPCTQLWCSMLKLASFDKVWMRPGRRLAAHDCQELQASMKLRGTFSVPGQQRVMCANMCRYVIYIYREREKEREGERERGRCTISWFCPKPPPPIGQQTTLERNA